MILIRDVFQAPYGQGGDLVAHFQEARQQWSADYATRILTDAGGRFFTVIVETEVDSLADWERRQADIFNEPGFDDWFARMQPLVESGQREFYNIET